MTMFIQELGKEGSMNYSLHIKHFLNLQWLILVLYIECTMLIRNSNEKSFTNSKDI